MKKIIILLVAILSVISVYSQMPVNCDSDPCYQTQPWVSSMKQYNYGTLPDCNGCWVKIYYKTRSNSTLPHCQKLPPLPPIEYQLEYIVVSGTCYYPPCNYYPAFDMQQAYQEAMTSLLLEWNYGPVHPSECGPVFKDFTIISCFRELLLLNGNKILTYCSTSTCCKQDYQLCLEEGILKIKSIKTGSEGDCANDPNYPEECMTICNWIDDAVVPKRVYDDNNKSELNPLSVFPNPISNELLTFNILKDVIIQSISILNNDGKILKLEDNRISNGNQINLDGYPNGNYMLIINDKNGINYYSQFIINK